MAEKMEKLIELSDPDMNKRVKEITRSLQSAHAKLNSMQAKDDKDDTKTYRRMTRSKKKISENGEEEEEIDFDTKNEDDPDEDALQAMMSAA